MLVNSCWTLCGLTYVLLESPLGHFAAEHQLRHPVALHDAVVGALIVLRLDELGDNGLELLAVRLQRPVSDVHLVGGEADEWIEDQRCSQVIVFGQLLRSHARGSHRRAVGERGNKTVSEMWVNEVGI